MTLFSFIRKIWLQKDDYRTDPQIAFASLSKCYLMPTVFDA